jgi:hypothetical protein
MRLSYTVAAVILFIATPASAAIMTTEIGSFTGECVAYARSQVPSLPSGLITMRDKLRIMNSSICRPGSIAIIELGGSLAVYGHVAYVEACSANGITVREGNWRPGKITRRVATGGFIQATKDLKIMGYWQPGR